MHSRGYVAHWLVANIVITVARIVIFLICCGYTVSLVTVEKRRPAWSSLQIQIQKTMLFCARKEGGPRLVYLEEGNCIISKVRRNICEYRPKWYHTRDQQTCLFLWMCPSEPVKYAIRKHDYMYLLLSLEPSLSFVTACADSHILDSSFVRFFILQMN